MDITQATGGASGTVTPPATESARSNISSDFETFLRMLTVQLQNQDPLNPVESSDYALQLATFSGVEQAVLTNDLIKDLTTQLGGGGLASMAAWVGKEARAPAAVNFDGSPITLYPTPAPSADRAQMVVTSANGSEVQRFAMKIDADGSGEIDWDEFTGFLLQVSERNARNPWHYSLAKAYSEARCLCRASTNPNRRCLAQASSLIKPSTSVS